MRNIIIVLVVSGIGVFQWSCSKKKDNTIYTIEGVLYEGCNMKPVPDYELRLFQEGKQSITGSRTGGELDKTVTDINGRFKFSFKDLDGVQQEISHPQGFGFNDLMYNIPVRTSIDDLRVFLGLTYNISVYLDVKNPHTESDTMMYTTDNALVFLPGPFKSGHLFTASDIPILVMEYPESRSVFNYRLEKYKDLHKQFIITDYCDDTTIVTVVIE